MIVPSFSQPAPAVEAHTALRDALFAAAVAIAREHVDDFPGLLEFVQDQVLFVVGRPSRNAHGWIAPDTWRNANVYATEVYINADARGQTQAELATNLWTTVAHELAHAANFINNVADVSRQGRWHNRAFAEVAIALGAEVIPHPSVGHVTPGARSGSLTRYAEAISEIEDALVLAWSPNPRLHRPSGAKTTSEPGPSNGQDGDQPGTGANKYVMATCACVINRGQHRTIRVARGSWTVGPIHCSVCQTDFTAEPTVSVGLPAARAGSL